MKGNPCQVSTKRPEDDAAYLPVAEMAVISAEEEALCRNDPRNRSVFT